MQDHLKEIVPENDDSQVQAPLSVQELFGDLLDRLRLTPDGEPLVTHSSRLLPVRTADGQAAMLKRAMEPEERGGAELMKWWAGDGAARVLAFDGSTLVLERAEGPRSLAAMARDGRDDEASRILCEVAARLHAGTHRPAPPPTVHLRQWFAPLIDGPARDEGDGVLRQAAAAARALLDAPQDEVVLHGDLHHENVLDAGSARGWVAIDPKRLSGERGFDFANIFRDPDHQVATRPGRLARQSHVIAEAAGLDRMRLLRWTMAFASLSAVWALDEDTSPAEDLAIATLAAAELRNAG